MVGIYKVSRKPNFNENAGLPFTYFSCSNLDPELINELQMNGFDVHYEEALQEASYKAECDYEKGIYFSYDEAYEEAVAELDDWYDDEPCHEGEHEGVRYLTTWLGGALLLCVMDSPLRGKFSECSPCLPGALDGDTPGDCEGFDIPESWKRKG